MAYLPNIYTYIYIYREREREKLFDAEQHLLAYIFTGLMR